ncbi:unnamed protein product [Rotaria magnacalcarata]|uniref:Peptidase A2 domain-containing protein n=2 Tax=Rotaria magnacalcarata TaxID=392030 RepID=A0A819BAS2_9BILA|nr:unnamed protein product [Rotaria magnacalcarata]
MVQTRQQLKRKEEFDQLEFNKEFQRLAGIEIGQTTHLQDYEHFVYRPILFTMTDKLINTLLSHNLDKLPKFSGKSNENVTKWLHDITNELNMVKLDDQQKYSVVQTFLVDDARRWFINNMLTINDWSTFSIEIHKTFSSIMHQELALKKVGSRQQAYDETVLHYYNDMIELFDIIDSNMNDHYKIAYLKVAQFLELAQAEEKLDLSLNMEMNNLQLSHIDSVSAIKSSIKPYAPPPQQHKWYQSSTNVRCYKLGANDGSALAKLHSPSLIFISTWINSIRISTMIDTGATSSLITMSTIIKLNCQDQIHRHTGEITLGDSRIKITQHGWICLNLKIKNVNYQIRAIVVDCLTNNFILGMDFLRKYKVEIKISQQCLVMRYEHQYLYVKFERSNSARLSQQCTILPRCKAVVNAVIPGISNEKKMYLNVIDQGIQQHKRIRMCDGLVNVKDNNIQLIIDNPTKTIVTLPKSMVVGTVDHLPRDVYCSTLFSNIKTEETYVTCEKNNRWI